MKSGCFFVTLVLCLVGFATIPNVAGNANQTCNLEMYGNDVNAYWACAAQFALQSNWFPSPIAGLFSYQIWNGFDGFWQDGAVLEPMVNFVAYTNQTRYMSVIEGSWRDLYSLMEAYGPYPSFDDMGWYGLSYTRIHEVLGNRSTEAFLQTALYIFNWCWETGWDHSGTCQGGFWFDNTFNTKQTITNVQMLQLSARLYRLTGNKDILQKLNKISLYISANGLIDPDTFLVADGALPNCTSNKEEGYTYNSGVMIGALTELYKITNKTSYLDIADKMGQAVIRHYCNSTTGILVEPCEPNCDEDALMFKGIFVRYLRYFMDVLPDKSVRDWYQVWLDNQVKYNTANNICDKVPISKCNITFQDGPPFYNITGPVFSPHWQGPFTVGAPMQQTSVLDLFVSAIKSETRCQGPQCSYDPHNPSPQPLTCSSHPCPDKMDCCEYSPYTSFTCCAMEQTCNKKTGICE